MNKKDILLSVKDLKTYFPSGNAWFGKQQYVKAVNGVSLDIYKNEVVGLVGESGSGKTTLGRSVLRLVKSSSGEIIFNGKDILSMKNKELKNMHREMQLIFQDPYGSLSPRMQIRKIIAEPLLLHKMVSEEMIEKRVTELLKEVGLQSYFKDRYPHEMSGGQRQRIAIARVLGLQPQLIIADEAVSALDVSVTAQILNLLKKIQKKNGMSVLFISHDLKIISHISDRIMVMYEGKIVEKATTEELISSPLHPYTKLLIASIPGRQKRNLKKRARNKVNLTKLFTSMDGCSFVGRCSESQGICNKINPTLKKCTSGRYVACHFN